MQRIHDYLEKHYWIAIVVSLASLVVAVWSLFV